MWDLLVVGGGTAGIVGAKTAARLGARVALVERDRTGGDCLWTGCVPSKALLAAAGHAAQARRGSGLGVHNNAVTVDFSAVMQHVRAAIAHIEPVDSVESLQSSGVTVLHGTARFTGADTVEVDGHVHRFVHALVATGASPALPAVPGLVETQPMTSETIWSLQQLPARMVVMGGGSIGCELGQAFARLGSQVTLVEALPRVLSREDPDAALVVHHALEADGIDVRVGHRAVEAAPAGDGSGELVVESGSERARLPYDVLLVAVGRRPRSEGLGLDRAGVELDEHGFVRVDRSLRTSNRRVWAAGDITAHPQFTHVAGVHGSLAASNAVLGLRRKADLTAVPRVTFTDPEVASVGADSWARDGASTPRTATRQHDDVDRAVAERRTAGFARLVLDDSGKRIVGATVVGPRAGESLAELALAVRKGLHVSDVVSTMHAYPTYSDGPWNAAIAVVQQRLAQPRTRRVTGALVRVRRRWAALRSA